jgi:hypothetical protein
VNGFFSKNTQVEALAMRRDWYTRCFMFRLAGLQHQSGGCAHQPPTPAFIRASARSASRKLRRRIRRPSALWASAAALGLLLNSPGTRAAEAPVSRPNIVLVMVDNLDTGSINSLPQAG